MNIANHFNAADTHLETAKKQIDREDYRGARASLAKAYSHNRELLDHIQKLVALKAHVEHSAKETPG